MTIIVRMAAMTAAFTIQVEPKSSAISVMLLVSSRKKAVPIKKK